MSKRAEKQIETSTEPQLFEQVFKTTPLNVRGHFHLSGHFRGATHSDFNPKPKQPKFVPIMFHSLSTYQPQQLFETLRRMKKKDVNFDVIAENKETFISMSYDCLGFNDSYRSLRGNLVILGNTLDYKVFKIGRSNSYAYLQCVKRFSPKKLADPLEDFTSSNDLMDPMKVKNP